MSNVFLSVCARKYILKIRVSKNKRLGRYGHKHEPPHDKANKVACAPSKDSDQPGHPPILIRVFAVRMKEPWVLSYPMSAQRRLWSDWADARDDLCFRWAHSHIVGFVMRRLKCVIDIRTPDQRAKSTVCSHYAHTPVTEQSEGPMDTVVSIRTPVDPCCAWNRF